MRKHIFTGIVLFFSLVTELIRENIRQFMEGLPLKNQVGKERGY
ncbi:MAG TPA: hypothetical protein VKA68_13345 [bacterium]|nr:hypothetical protein [bacterium]